MQGRWSIWGKLRGWRKINTREDFVRKSVFAILKMLNLGRVTALGEFDWASAPSGLKFSYKLALFIGRKSTSSFFLVGDWHVTIFYRWSFWRHRPHQPKNAQFDAYICAGQFCHFSSSPPRTFPRSLGKGYAQAHTICPATRAPNSRTSTIKKESCRGTAE